MQWIAHPRFRHLVPNWVRRTTGSDKDDALTRIVSSSKTSRHSKTDALSPRAVEVVSRRVVRCLVAVAFCDDRNEAQTYSESARKSLAKSNRALLQQLPDPQEGMCALPHAQACHKCGAASQNVPLSQERTRTNTNGARPSLAGDDSGRRFLSRSSTRPSVITGAC